LTPWDSLPPNRHTGAPMAPRAWQLAALDAARDALRSGARPLVVAGTGSGKAVWLVELARMLAARCAPEERVVVSAPTIALVEQLREDLRRRPVDAGAYYTAAKEVSSPVIVVCNPSAPAMVRDLAERGLRVRAWIADEAHKTRSEGMDAAIREAAPRWLVGCTATPYRSVDTESLRLFDSVAFRYTMEDATRDGVLVPYVTRSPITAWGELLVDEATIRLIEEHTTGPGVVGASSVPDALDFAARLCARGIPAEAIHAGTPPEERAALIEDLRTGALRCLVHVALLIEGVDLPWLTWLALRRPLTSPVALVQQIGRVLRAFPGKTGAVVLDPHGLLWNRNLGKPDSIGDLEGAAVAALERPTSGAAIAASREERWAVAVSESQHYARDVLLALAASGVVAPRVAAAAWRELPASPAQLSSYDRMWRAWGRYLPGPVREGMGALRDVHAALRLDRGTVSDALSILRAVAEQAPDGDWQSRSGWGGPTWPDVEWPVLPAGVADEARKGRARAERARGAA
jgi:hypothetical protein